VRTGVFVAREFLEQITAVKMVPVKYCHEADFDPEPDRSLVKTPVKEHEPKAE